MAIEELQIHVRIFIEQNGLDCPLSARILDLISESGELCKEYLKGSAYGGREFSAGAEWRSELGDLFFSLICVANRTDSNLGECLESALEKYRRRLAAGGDSGSGR